MNQNQETSEKLNEVLRGERSAVETYQQAFGKVGDDPRVDELRPLAADHRHAVQLLAERIRAAGGSPSNDSGAWGTWAKTVMGTAKIFGDKAALTALKEGEEHGKKQYEELLKQSDIDPSSRTIIQNELLPQQEQHIRTLERIIETLH
jgi:uncharacterized protein (TIGR02284 family)